MKKEQIEEAAQEHCVIDRSIYNDRFQPYYINGFKDGADWRINSVWHDKTEAPIFGMHLLVLDNDNLFDLKFLDLDDDVRLWDYRREMNWKCWAYIDDLLPDAE